MKAAIFLALFLGTVVSSDASVRGMKKMGSKGKDSAGEGSKGKSSNKFVAKFIPDSPSVMTEVTGDVKMTLSRDESELSFKVSSYDMVGVGLLGVYGMHIHCADPTAAGPVVAALAGAVPGGLKGKVKMEGTLTDANILPNEDHGCGSTIAEVAESMRNGSTYVNIHSIKYPSGEVRANLMVK